MKALVRSMTATADLEKIATELLERRGLRLLSCTTIQSLWAGYGHICRIKALSTGTDVSNTSNRQSKPQSLILKFVQPPAKVKTRKAQLVDEGHLRKVLSYQIEQFFYTYLAPLMPAEIGIASCISSINSCTESTNVTAMIMTDLRESFPIAGERQAGLSETQTYSALSWLAQFHGFWWSNTEKLDEIDLVLPPLERFAKHGNAALTRPSVWLNGGYTYLATRRQEYAELSTDSNSEWSSALCTPVESGGPSIAELVATWLSSVTTETKDVSTQATRPRSSQQFRTLLHGDVKSENLFTTSNGKSAAFYDFQYIGLGLGVCDLAKFFTCCVPLDMLLEDIDDVYQISELSMQPKEEELLRRYLSQACSISGKEYEWNIFHRHWSTALVDWLRFQASWGFWGNSEWLEARVRSILANGDWFDWLKDVNEIQKQ